MDFCKSKFRNVHWSFCEKIVERFPIIAAKLSTLEISPHIFASPCSLITTRERHAFSCDIALNGPVDLRGFWVMTKCLKGLNLSKSNPNSSFGRWGENEIANSKADFYLQAHGVFHEINCSGLYIIEYCKQIAFSLACFQLYVVKFLYVKVHQKNKSLTLIKVWLELHIAYFASENHQIKIILVYVQKCTLGNKMRQFLKKITM